MGKKITWFVLVLLILLAGIWRYWSKPKIPIQDLNPSASSSELSIIDKDFVIAKEAEIMKVISFTGQIKSFNSVVVKAKTAGELLNLSVREGQVVQSGEVIGNIEQTETQHRLLQAQEQIKVAHSQLQIAQKQYDNNLALVQQGFISQTVLETSLQNLNAALANVRAAEQASEIFKKNLNDARVVAPLNGKVSTIYAKAGERVAIDGRIVEIVDVNHFEIEGQIGAQQLPHIRLKQRAVFSIYGSHEKLNAQVERISPVANSSSRTPAIYLKLNDLTNHLIQGNFVQGEIIVSRSQSVAVPSYVVHTENQAQIIQVVQDNRVAHFVVNNDESGKIQGSAESWIVVKNLPNNAIVLKGNIALLAEGTKVNLKNEPN